MTSAISRCASGMGVDDVVDPGSGRAPLSADSVCLRHKYKPWNCSMMKVPRNLHPGKREKTGRMRNLFLKIILKRHKECHCTRDKNCSLDAKTRMLISNRLNFGTNRKTHTHKNHVHY